MQSEAALRGHGFSRAVSIAFHRASAAAGTAIFKLHHYRKVARESRETEVIARFIWRAPCSSSPLQQARCWRPKIDPNLARPAPQPTPVTRQESVAGGCRRPPGTRALEGAVAADRGLRSARRLAGCGRAEVASSRSPVWQRAAERTQFRLSALSPDSACPFWPMRMFASRRKRARRIMSAEIGITSGARGSAKGPREAHGASRRSRHGRVPFRPVTH